MRARARTWLVVLGAMACARPIGAQTVSVQVLDASDGRPMQGAMVYLSFVDRSLRASGLSDTAGRVLFTDLVSGRYSLRVDMIGRSSETLEMVLGDAQHVVEEIRLKVRPIPIQGLDIAVGERCRIDPQQGLLVGQVWDEARKALAITAYAERERFFRYETILYERDLDRAARTILRQIEERNERDLRSPFVTLPVQDLLENGFVQQSGGAEHYYGPDADLLLSEPFLRSHCMTLRRGDATGDGTALVGLRFEPTGHRGDKVDITGTLWLDVTSSELQWLDFHYTNLPPNRRDERVGGRVDFRRMPDGTWIVSEWWIRMPSMRVQRDREFRVREYIAGFRESGGLVVSAERRGIAISVQSVLGTIDGTVMDYLGQPAPDTRVEVVGTYRSTIADGSGRFAFRDLPGGLYQIRAQHPRMALHNQEGPSVVARAMPGATESIDLRLPDLAVHLTEQCRDHIPGRPNSAPPGPWPPGSSIAFGQVLNDAGKPVSGVDVRVSWSTFSFEARPTVGRGQARSGRRSPPVAALIGERSFGFETPTDENGVFRICGIKELTRVSVSATLEDEVLQTDTIIRFEVPGELAELVLVLGARRTPAPR